MPYVGSSAAIIPVAFSSLNSQSFNGDDSSVDFTLNRAVLNAKQIEVLVNNVQQSPYDGSYSVFNPLPFKFSNTPQNSH